MSQQQKELVFSELGLSIANLLIEKNSGYGDSFTKLTIKNIADRIIEKMTRILNLLELPDNKDGVDESIEDAFNDTGGYAILGVIHCNKEDYAEVFKWGHERYTDCLEKHHFLHYPYCPYCGERLS